MAGRVPRHAASDCIAVVHMCVCMQDICGYEGMLPVAVKTLSSLKKDEMEKFYEEIEMMRTFTHPNIVSLLGTALCGRSCCRQFAYSII